MKNPINDESANAWRVEPPTADEVRRQSWWWNKPADGVPHILQLDCDPDNDRIFNAGEAGKGVWPAPFDPTDWPGTWAPCTTPDDVAGLLSRTARAALMLVRGHVRREAQTRDGLRELIAGAPAVSGDRASELVDLSVIRGPHAGSGCRCVACRQAEAMPDLIAVFLYHRKMTATLARIADGSRPEARQRSAGVSEGDLRSIGAALEILRSPEGRATISTLVSLVLEILHSPEGRATISTLASENELSEKDTIEP